MADQPARFKGVLVRHGDDFVVHLRIEHLRHEARADALNLVRARHAGGEHGGGRRLDGDNLHLRLFRLQVLAHAGDRAAGAHARHEDVHLAVGVVVDLRAGRLPVCLRVGGIDKLAGHEAVRNLRRKLLRLGDGALHALRALGKHQLRAVGLHQLAALDGHGLRHHDDDAVAPGRGHCRQADARVAAGRLNDHGAGPELAAGLRLVDHGLGDAVLDRAGRIEVFQLGQHARLEAQRLLDVRQLQQRGFADQLIGGCINPGHSRSPLPGRWVSERPPLIDIGRPRRAAFHSSLIPLLPRQSRAQDPPEYRRYAPYRWTGGWCWA